MFPKLLLAAATVIVKAGTRKTTELEAAFILVTYLAKRLRR